MRITRRARRRPHGLHRPPSVHSHAHPIHRRGWWTRGSQTDPSGSKASSCLGRAVSVGVPLWEHHLSGMSPLSPPHVPSCQWHLASPATCYPEDCCFSSWTSTSLLPLCWHLASPASILSRPCDQSHFSNTNWIVSLWLQSLPRGQAPTPRPGPWRLARPPPSLGWLAVTPGRSPLGPGSSAPPAFTSVAPWGLLLF